MIQDISTVWLYAYSPDADTPSRALYTVFTGNNVDLNGRAILATVSLMLLCWSMGRWGRRSGLAQGSEDLTGDVALQAAHDLRLRPSFAGPPPHIVDCRLV